jgi:hypothetical protein
MIEVAVPSATVGLEPVIAEVAEATAPATKFTVPSVFTTGVAMERVLSSAFVELKAQVETPEAFVAEQDP